MDITLESESTEKVDNSRKSNTSKTLSFPSTVGSSTDDRHTNYLVFNAVKPITENQDMRSNALRARRSAYLKASKNKDRTKLKEKTLAYIQLYMPALNEQLGHNYEQSESSFLGDIVNRIGKVIKNNESVSDVSLNEIGDVAGDIGTSAFEAIKAAGANASRSTVAQTTGRIYGERSVGVYQDTNLRTQEFTFRLVPRDLQELKVVGKIIHQFRKYSSAKLISENIKDDVSYNTIEVPPLWYIEERIRDENLPRYIPKFNFGPAVVTNVSVNKTPEELYKHFDKTGGDPVAIELQLSFQELIPVYQQYWEQSDEGII